MATPQPTFAFTKMQGAGNDFILFDNRTLKMSDGELTRLAPVFCNRKFGIGSDGIIALNYDDTQQADLVMNYKNPDGSDAGMCGNGARCFAAFAATLGCPEQFSFRVHNHVYRANIRGEQVTIHFPLETTVEEMIVEEFNVLNVYTNTEHVVCPVQPEVLENESRLITDGRFFRYHDDFQPKGTNVNFISGTDRNQLSLQTYERGVENLTLACGTGAIASALAWHHLQQGSQGDHRFTVKVRGGLLQIHFSFDETNQTYSNIQLEGPATFVFEGQFYL